jgi:tetratricopeptide (TPR) repeat protein
MIRSLRAPFLFAALAATVAGMTAQADEYRTYQEARAAGAKAVRDGNLAAAREPLEAAARLATTEREKLEAHRALLTPYRELQDVEPMQRAAEFIIAHSTQPAERSLTRSALLSFIHKRGKTDDAVAKYEARVEKDASDRTALYLLTEAYATHKKDPARAADRGEKLAAVEKKAGLAPDPADQAKLAGLYVSAGRHRDGAELFEAVAPSDPKTEAWHRKEAAAAWLKAGDRVKAVAAARRAAAAAPEARSDQLTYFWRRGLGDVLLEAGEPKDAIPHYERALTATKIDGYVKDTKAKLEKARAAAGM